MWKQKRGDVIQWLRNLLNKCLILKVSFWDVPLLIVKSMHSNLLNQMMNNFGTFDLQDLLSGTMI